MSADPIPELQRLGQHLCDARVQQGISLEELAQRLNMGREQLHSLETADRSGLPEPVFVIAQARRVAGALGVGIDPQVRALRQSEAFATPRAEQAAPRPEPVRPRLAGGPGGTVRGGKREACRAPLRPLAIGALVAGLGAAGIALQQHRWTVLPVELPSSPPAAAPSDRGGATSQRPSSSPAGLQLRARQPSWLEVRTATGLNLFRGTLEGERSFPLDNDLLVLAGRPDLVDVAVHGGEPQTLGRIDAVRWQRFPAAVRAPAP